jgi:hypothetical protein
MKLSGSGVIALATVIGLGAAIAALWKNRAAVGAAVNPLSDRNLAYQGANALTQAITGNKVDTVGTQIANRFPGAAERAVNSMLSAKPLSPGAATITINPFERFTAAPTSGGAAEFMFGLNGVNTQQVSARFFDDSLQGLGRFRLNKFFKRRQSVPATAREIYIDRGTGMRSDVRYTRPSTPGRDN